MTLSQHTMQKLHKMSFGGVDFESYPTRPVVVPKPPASAIYLDFLNIAYKDRDNSLTLAAGARRGQF